MGRYGKSLGDQVRTEAHSDKTATINILDIWKLGNKYPEYFSTSVPPKAVLCRSSEVLPSSLAVLSHLFEDGDA
jgi:hypothetical protein